MGTKALRAFVNERHRVPLLGCECGEWGCLPLLATMTVLDDAVRWSDFEQPQQVEGDYSGFGPFQFGREEHEHEIETLERAVEGLGQARVGPDRTRPGSVRRERSVSRAV
jgi:hypothetical protein